MYSKKGFKSWLPEYPQQSAGPRVPQELRDAGLEEEVGTRVRKCHKETTLKGDQTGWNEWGPSCALPSSCSATCRKCRDIPPSLFMQDGPNEYILYESHHQLSKSANNGCCLCWFWFQHLRRVLSILESYDFREDHLDEDSTGELIIKLRRPEAIQPLRWILLSYGKLETRVFWSLAENGVYCGRVSIYSDIDENVKLAKSWISACLKDHDRCRQPSHILNQYDPPPSRLIRVYKYLGDIKVRLVETADKSWRAGVPYLTLSHCWGREPSIEKMTTVKNVRSRMVDIPLETLPQTIQDAIVITFKLGFGYIWIDSLCIVQDSVEDWERVCRSMAAIYSNSACTIAASAADNDNDGCLVRKDKDSIGWMGLEFPYPKACNLMANRIICDQKWPSRISTTAKEVILYPVMKDPRSLVESGPLSRRGWCLQERLLAPRVLHFTQQELVWECETTWSFEDSLRATIEKKSAWGDSHPQNKRAIYDAWLSIVRGFTNANLTRYADRLPALSGLADKFLEKLPNDEYVAGLWKSDLIRGLFWAKNGLNPRSLQKPPIYLAPSWSWASVDGPVFFPPVRHTSDSPSLMDVKVVVAGLDPLGQTSGGRLLLRGRLKPVRRGRPVPRGSCLPPPRALVSLPTNYSVTDVREAELWLSTRYTLVDGDGDDIDSLCGQIYFDTEADSHLESLYCLQMTRNNDTSQTNIYIIAFASTKGSAGAFRRVGIGEILRKDWFEDCEENPLEIV